MLESAERTPVRESAVRSLGKTLRQPSIAPWVAAGGSDPCAEDRGDKLGAGRNKRKLARPRGSSGSVKDLR
jgi:hypothetical protein